MSIFTNFDTSNPYMVDACYYELKDMIRERPITVKDAVKHAFRHGYDRETIYRTMKRIRRDHIIVNNEGKYFISRGSLKTEG